ncbi:MAG: FtsX-like permease family protein [Oscillospiraceae bacterium]|nr:FtsX-like permease family protein [Oscillospiraceae bacterium]
MKLVVSPAGMVIAAVVCLVTTLISAWIPARRANRVSAIDAIRQTGDIKVRGKDVKVSGLTKKLFGFEGMMASKNFKRNRKSYRATVVSLFLSVTLFIAASSFCDYLTQAVSTVRSNDSRVDITYATVGDGRTDPDGVLAVLTGVPGVKAGCYLESNSYELRVDPDAVTDEYVNRYGAPESTGGVTGAPAHANLIFVNDAAFRALCADNGLNADDYYDPTAPKGLLYNHAAGQTIDQDGNRHWYDVKMIDESKLPLEMYASEVRQFDGYTMADVEDGKYYYYPDEYMQEMNDRWRNGEDAALDRSRAMVKTAEEAEERRYLTVHAVVKETLFALPDGMTALIYPYEMRGAVLGENAAEALFQTDFALQATDHARVFEAIKKELTARGMETGRLFDMAAEKESMRMIVTVVRVFSYGFIILISLIAMANVFNTVSTNVMLRRREFAMLKSIGLGEKGFRKMMNYECIIYGCKGLLWGLPAAVALTYLIYRITGNIVERGFYIPWYSVAIAVGSVFAVVFATMLYATRAIRRDNPIDALRQENL